MTEWKPKAGEDAVVRVVGLLTTTDGQYHAQIERSRATIPIAALRPLPTALSAEDALRDPSEEEVERAWCVYRDTKALWEPSMRAALRDFLGRRRSTPPAAVAAFKVGDRVRHKATGNLGVVSDAKHPWPCVRFDNGNALWMTADDLEIATTPRDATALRDAVVEAAKKQLVAFKEALREDDMDTYDQATTETEDAARALLAAEAPADPVAELREAAAGVLGMWRQPECAEIARLRAALSALGDRGRR